MATDTSVRAAGAVVFKRSRDQPFFLIIRDGHGNWGLPKGHAEEGESPLQTAKREVAEETGLDRLVWLGEINREQWSYRRGGREVTKNCIYFLARLDQPANLDLAEDEGIAEARWLDASAAVELATFDTVSRTVEQAAAAIEDGMGFGDSE